MSDPLHKEPQTRVYRRVSHFHHHHHHDQARVEEGERPGFFRRLLHRVEGKHDEEGVYENGRKADEYEGWDGSDRGQEGRNRRERTNEEGKQVQEHGYGEEEGASADEMEPRDTGTEEGDTRFEPRSEGLGQQGDPERTPIERDSPPSESSFDRTDSEFDQEPLPHRPVYNAASSRSSSPLTAYSPPLNGQPPYSPPLRRAPPNPLPSNQPPIRSSAEQERENVRWMAEHPPPGSQIRPIQQTLQPSQPPPPEFHPRTVPRMDEPSPPLEINSRRYSSSDDSSIDPPPPRVPIPSEIANPQEQERNRSRWSRASVDPPREATLSTPSASRPLTQDYPSPRQEPRQFEEHSSSEMDSDDLPPRIPRSRPPPAIQTLSPVPVARRRDENDFPTNQDEFSEDSDPSPAPPARSSRRARDLESSGVPRRSLERNAVVDETSLPSDSEEEEERPVRSYRQRPTSGAPPRIDTATPRTYRQPSSYTRPTPSEVRTSEEESDYNEPIPSSRQSLRPLPSEVSSSRNGTIPSSRRSRPIEGNQSPPSFERPVSRPVLPEVSDSDLSNRSPEIEDKESMPSSPETMRRRHRARNLQTTPPEPPTPVRSSTPPPPADTHTDSEQSEFDPEDVLEPSRRQLSAQSPTAEPSEEDERVERRKRMPTQEARREEHAKGREEGRSKGREEGRSEGRRIGGYQTDSSREMSEGEDSDVEESKPAHEGSRRMNRGYEEPMESVEPEEEDAQIRGPTRNPRPRTLDESADENAQAQSTQTRSAPRTWNPESNNAEDRESESHESQETAPQETARPLRPFVPDQRSSMPSSTPREPEQHLQPSEYYERRSEARFPETDNFDHSSSSSPDFSPRSLRERPSFDNQEDQSDFRDPGSASDESRISQTSINRLQNSYVKGSDPDPNYSEQDPTPAQSRNEEVFGSRERSRRNEDLDRDENGTRRGEPIRDESDDDYHEQDEPTPREHDELHSKPNNASFATTRDTSPIEDSYSPAEVQTDSEDESPNRMRNVEPTSKNASPLSNTSNRSDQDEDYSPPPAGEVNEFSDSSSTAPSRIPSRLREEQANASSASPSYDDDVQAEMTTEDRANRYDRTPPFDSSRRPPRLEEDRTQPSQESDARDPNTFHRSSSNVEPEDSDSSDFGREEEPNQAFDEVQSQPRARQAFAPASRSSLPPTSSYETADSDPDLDSVDPDSKRPPNLDSETYAAPPVSSSASSYDVTPRDDYREIKPANESRRNDTFDEDPRRRQDNFEDSDSDPSNYRQGDDLSARASSRDIDSEDKEESTNGGDTSRGQSRSEDNGEEREFDTSRHDEEGEDAEGEGKDTRGARRGRNREETFEPEDSTRYGGDDRKAMSSTNYANSRQSDPSEVDEPEEGVQTDSEDGEPPRTQTQALATAASEESGRREALDAPSTDRNETFPDRFSNTPASKEESDDFRSGEDEDRSPSPPDRSHLDEESGQDSIPERDSRVKNNSLSDDEAEDQFDEPKNSSKEDQDFPDEGDRRPRDDDETSSFDKDQSPMQDRQQSMDQDSFDKRGSNGGEDTEERQDPASLSDTEQDRMQSDDRFDDPQQQPSREQGRGGGRNMDDDDSFSPQSRNFDDDAGASSRGGFDQKGGDFDGAGNQDTYGGGDRFSDNDDFSNDKQLGSSDQDDFGTGRAGGYNDRSDMDGGDFGGSGGGYEDRDNMGGHDMGGDSWNDQSMRGRDEGYGGDSFDGDQSMSGRDRDFDDGSLGGGTNSFGREDPYGENSYGGTRDDYDRDPDQDEREQDWRGGGESWDERGNPNESWRDRNGEEEYPRTYERYGDEGYRDEGYETQSEPSEEENYAAVYQPARQHHRHHTSRQEELEYQDAKHRYETALHSLSSLQQNHRAPPHHRLERAIHEVFESVYALREKEKEGRRPQTPIPTAAELNISLEDYHHHLSSLQERTGSEVDEARDRLREEDTEENRKALSEAEARHKAATDHGQEHHLQHRDDHEELMDDPMSTPEEIHQAALSRHTAAHHEALRADKEVDRAKENLERCVDEGDPRAIDEAKAQLHEARMRQKLAHSDREEAKEHVDAAAAAVQAEASSQELHHDPVIAAHLSAVQGRDAAESEVSHRKAGLEAAQNSGDHRQIRHAQARLDHAQSDLAKAKDEEGESKRGLSLHERTAVAAVIHHHATEDLNHHKRNLDEINANPDAFSPEERAAARHAHATAVDRHAAARNRHRHLKDKLTLHHHDPTLTPEENHEHRHAAAHNLFAHHDDKIRAIEAEHEAARRHLEQNPNDLHARKEYEAAQAKLDKIAEHRNSRHSAAAHLVDTHHRKVLEARRRRDANPNDQEAQTALEAVEEHHAKLVHREKEARRDTGHHHRMSVAAMIHHHATEDLNHHKRNLDEINANPDAFSPEERAAARHAHATAVDRHAAARNRHRHLKDKLTLHHHDPTLTPEENHEHRHAAAHNFFAHHDDKIRAIEAEHEAARRHLEQNPNDLHARKEYEAAQAKLDKIAEHRNSRHSAAAHLVDTHHRKVLEARRRRDANPNDQEAQTALEAVEEHHAKLVHREKEARRDTGHHHRMSVAAMIHHHATEDLNHHKRNLDEINANPDAFSPEERAAARHAHATAVDRHAAARNRHRHLKDKLTLHHHDPTLTPEENHEHRHAAAHNLFAHHDDKIRAIEAEHEAARRHLEQNPNDLHARKEYEAAQAKLDKIAEHRNSRHSAAAHLVDTHHRKVLEARIRRDANPNDQEAQTALEAVEEHHAKLVHREKEARRDTGHHHRMSVAAMIHHHATEDLNHHKRNLDEINANPDAFSPEERAAARHAHATAVDRHAAARNRHRHLKDKLTLHHHDPTLTPEENHEHRHAAAHNFFAHHDDKIRAIEAEHEAARRHLEQNPNDLHARKEYEAAQAKLDKIAEHRNSRHSAAAHLVDTHHRKVLEARRRRDANPNDQEAQTALEAVEEHHAKLVHREKEARRDTGHHHRMSVAAMIHHHATEDLNHHKRNLDEINANPDAFSPEERAAARHAHATAVDRHAAARNRHRHLKDKLTLHHHDPTLTPEENHEHRHAAAHNLFAHHDDKIRAIEAEHEAARRHLEQNPNDLHARKEYEAAQAKLDKIAEHRNSRHSAAAHLVDTHHRKVLEARRRRDANPNDQEAQTALKAVEEHHAKLVHREKEARRDTGHHHRMSVAAMIHHHATEDLSHHKRNLDEINANPDAFSPEERAAARHAHATAVDRHAAARNRHRHLKDKLTLHHHDPTLTPEENHEHRHAAAHNLFAHHDDKIRAIEAEHEAARRHLEQNPNDLHARKEYEAAQAKLDKIAEHRNSRHSAAAHLVDTHHRKVLEARRRRDANPNDQEAQTALEAVEEHHAKLVHREKEARRDTGHHHRMSVAAMIHHHATEDLSHHKRNLRRANEHHRSEPTLASKEALRKAQENSDAAKELHNKSKRHHLEQRAEHSHHTLISSKHAHGSEKHEAIVHHHHRAISDLLKHHESHRATHDKSRKTLASQLSHHHSKLSDLDPSHPQHEKTRKHISTLERKRREAEEKHRVHQEKVRELRARKEELEKEHRDSFKRKHEEKTRAREEKSRTRKEKMEHEREKRRREKEAREREEHDRIKHKHESEMAQHTLKEHEKEVAHRRKEAAHSKKLEHDHEELRRHKAKVEADRHERDRLSKEKHRALKEKHRHELEEKKREKEGIEHERSERKRRKAEKKRRRHEAAEAKKREREEAHRREKERRKQEKAEKKRREKERRDSAHERSQSRSRSRSRSTSRVRVRSRSGRSRNRKH